MATVVFCSDPTRRSRPDPDYTAEAEAATEAGFHVELIDHDALLRGDVAGALAQVAKRASTDKTLFRGWMMPPSAYAKLHAGLQDRGMRLAEGLVFREYVELETIGTHPRSGMPLAREHRYFVLHGKPVLASAYWEYGDAGAPPPFEAFADLAGKVQSSFFTLDVAKRVNGEWIVIELGDGGVAGLPERADPAEFYRVLFAGLG